LIQARSPATVVPKSATAHLPDLNRPVLASRMEGA
jgi:hypothetical protein